MRTPASLVILATLAAASMPAQTAAGLAPVAMQQFFDASTGTIVACVGCTLSTFAAGTNTPLKTYVDSTLTTQNATVITLNSGGYTQSGIWIGSACYKFILANAAGATIWSQDQICDASRALKAALATSTGAAAIGFTQPSGTATTVQAALRATARLTDYAVSATSAADQTTAVGAAVTAAIADGFQALIVPPGTYKISNLVLNPSSSFMFMCQPGAIFKAAADSHPVLKFSAGTGGLNVGTVGGDGCSIDLGASYTATDGVYFDTVISGQWTNYTFFNVPADHAGLKGGSLIYGIYGPGVTYGSAGRCIDILNAYSNAHLGYGINVGTFLQPKSTCASSQGIRISGQWNAETMDWEGALASGTRAGIDTFETSIISDVKIEKIYIESSALAANQYAVYSGGGAFALHSGQIVFSDGTGGSASTCFVSDAVAVSLTAIDISGVHFRGCDTAANFGSVPISANTFPGATGQRGGFNFRANYYDGPATAGCSFQSGILVALRNYSQTPVYLECPEVNLGIIMAAPHATLPIAQFGGVPFTVSGCVSGAATGGPTVGTFVSNTTGTCTSTLTLNGAFGWIADHGWVCLVNDGTTPIPQSSSTTTTCTVSGTTVATDVLRVVAFPY